MPPHVPPRHPLLIEYRTGASGGSRARLHCLHVISWLSPSCGGPNFTRRVFQRLLFSSDRHRPPFTGCCSPRRPTRSLSLAWRTVGSTGQSQLRGETRATPKPRTITIVQKCCLQSAREILHAIKDTQLKGNSTSPDRIAASDSGDDLWGPTGLCFIQGPASHLQPTEELHQSPASRIVRCPELPGWHAHF